MGVEPTSPAWKAGVIAVIRQPRIIDNSKKHEKCQERGEQTQRLASSFPLIVVPVI